MAENTIETEEAFICFFYTSMHMLLMRFHTVCWRSVSRCAVRVACKNVVTVSVTELHCFSFPQDTLVKPKAKFSNKHRIPPISTTKVKTRGNTSNETSGLQGWKNIILGLELQTEKQLCSMLGRNCGIGVSQRAKQAH